MKSPAVLLAVVAVAALLQAAHSAEPADDTPALLLQAANRLRAGAGLAPLAAEARLARAAAGLARYMAETDRYGHDADGREPAARVEAAGYAWCRVAENIAWQYDSRGLDSETLAARLAEGWAASPPHRRNLLDAGVRQAGMAVAQSRRTGRHYGVQVFARPCQEHR